MYSGINVRYYHIICKFGLEAIEGCTNAV